MGAPVIAVKVMDSRGNGQTSTIIAGIDYVFGKLVQDGSGNLLINVVNMSFGGGKSTELDNVVIALAAKGAYICIAAGNSKKNAVNYSPSRVSDARIYTISAHDATDKFATFSNWGNPPIDFAAPGVNILSCYFDGKYAVMSGTSMAAPHCCGILLSTWGNIYSRGNVTNDRDSNPDLIATQINSGGGGD
jgi:subtilisin family serine protease